MHALLGSCGITELPAGKMTALCTKLIATIFVKEYVSKHYGGHPLLPEVRLQKAIELFGKGEVKTVKFVLGTSCAVIAPSGAASAKAWISRNKIAGRFRMLFGAKISRYAGLIQYLRQALLQFRKMTF